ncbi:hypothetical protein Tco_0740781, partial [Tanacetum coccineum]
DAIRAKLEANAELTKDVLGKDLPEQDFAKRMVEMVNQRKKHFAEERAKAKRNKPMTQSLLRIYMSNYLKNQGTWKISQLKKLKFEEIKEIKEEFDKLVQQIDTFVPINLEATKAKLKRYGEELQTKTLKKQRFDDKYVPAIREKVAKSAQEDSETDKEESVEAMNPTPLTTKSDIYMSFGAMVKDFTRKDVIELYRLVMQKYGTNRPEDAYDRVLWSDLKTMFDPPLNEDAIWSLPLQQKMISWKYYDKCVVHYLTLEASSIYMLADRKYPLSKDACQVMLKTKLLDGTMDEVCYKLLKMIEKFYLRQQTPLRQAEDAYLLGGAIDVKSVDVVVRRELVDENKEKDWYATRRQEVWNDCAGVAKVRLVLNGNLLWEASVLLGRKKGKEDVHEVFQQRGSGAKRKLSRCGRNQMGNEPILALPEGADDFIVYYDTRSKIIDSKILVKVRWNSKRGLEFTWEREDYMKSKYPQLFVGRADESAS